MISIIASDIQIQAQEPVPAESAVFSASSATDVEEATFIKPQIIEKTQEMYSSIIDQVNDGMEELPFGGIIVDFLMSKFYGNSIYTWMLAFLVAYVLYWLLRGVRLTVCRRMKFFAQSHPTRVNDIAYHCVEKTHRYFLFAIALFIATLFLELPPRVRWVFWALLQVALVVQAAIWAGFFIRTWMYHYMAEKAKHDSTSLGALSIFNFITQMLIWSCAVILLLGNLGVDITALVTGLGIGGVAVALAVQNVLGDLLASLSIIFDKPFVKGDFILFEDKFMGSVEHIGIKTTRLRSLSGEQVICPNNAMVSTRIRNFKRMKERRIQFNIGVTYDTPLEKLKQIPTLIRSIVESISITRFDRAHFSSYGDSSLNYEIVYYVLSPDYNTYMDIQQKINLDIYGIFQQEEIQFAFPSRTVYLESKLPIFQEPPAVETQRDY